MATTAASTPIRQEVVDWDRLFELVSLIANEFPCALAPCLPARLSDDDECDSYCSLSVDDLEVVVRVLKLGNFTTDNGTVRSLTSVELESQIVGVPLEDCRCAITRYIIACISVLKNKMASTDHMALLLKSLKCLVGNKTWNFHGQNEVVFRLLQGHALRRLNSIASAGEEHIFSKIRLDVVDKIAIQVPPTKKHRLDDAGILPIQTLLHGHLSATVAQENQHHYFCAETQTFLVFWGGRKGWTSEGKGRWGVVDPEEVLIRQHCSDELANVPPRPTACTAKNGENYWTVYAPPLPVDSATAEANGSLNRQDWLTSQKLHVEIVRGKPIGAPEAVNIYCDEDFVKELSMQGQQPIDPHLFSGIYTRSTPTDGIPPHGHELLVCLEFMAKLIDPFFQHVAKQLGEVRVYA